MLNPKQQRHLFEIDRLVRRYTCDCGIRPRWTCTCKVSQKRKEKIAARQKLKGLKK